MKKALQATLFIVTSALVLVGCGISGGYVQDHGGTNISYQIPVVDMKYEGTVSAMAKGPSVFCVFPTYDTLYLKAVDELNTKAGLPSGNKILLNARVDEENYFYVFWCTKYVTVSADLYTIVKEKPVAPPSIEDQKELSLEEPKKEEPKKSKFEDPAERKAFLAPFWEALKNKDFVKIRDGVFDKMADMPEILKQEGFYFMGDVALLQNDVTSADVYYKKGVVLASPHAWQPDYTGLKYHLQQFTALFPDKKDAAQNIFATMTK